MRLSESRHLGSNPSPAAMNTFTCTTHSINNKGLLIFFVCALCGVLFASVALAQSGDVPTGDSTGGTIPQENPALNEAQMIPAVEVPIGDLTGTNQGVPVSVDVPVRATTSDVVNPATNVSTPPSSVPSTDISETPAVEVPIGDLTGTDQVAPAVEGGESSATGNNSVGMIVLVGVALGAMFGGIGIYRIRSKNSKKEHTTDRCQQIAEALTQKKQVLAGARGKFSIQEAIIKALKKKLSEVKSKIQGAVKDKVKDSVVALDTSGTTKKVVDAIDEAQKAYDDILKKIDQAHKILNILRSQVNQLNSDISTLESTYNACVLAVTGKEIIRSSGKGKEIPLPNVPKGKILKFSNHLVPLILSSEKQSTIRFFDDKDLKRGDKLSLVNKNTDEQFGEATITHLYEKKFIDLTGSDYEKNEKHESAERMREAYQGYYDGKITPDTIAKIITFELKHISHKEK